jgi:hypothetical protein
MLFLAATAAINSGSLNLATGNYYAHLVSTLPSLSVSSIGQLNLCAGDDYVPAILTGLVYVPGTKWTFDDFRFAVTKFSTPVVAVVICKRIGVSVSTLDFPIAFSELSDTSDRIYQLAAATFSLDVDFPPSGAIEF